MVTVYQSLATALIEAGVQAEFVTGGLTADELRVVQNAARTDQSVMEFTADPERFLDRTATQNWLSKRRYICKLVGADGELLGLAWLGQKSIPEYATRKLKPELSARYGHTLSLRTYGNIRGKHLAGPFVQAALNQYIQNCGEANPGFWAETSAANLPLQRVISKLGFVKIADEPERNKLVYVWPFPASSS